MSEGPTYVYDLKSQFQEPLIVVYRREHAEVVVAALGLNVDDLYITKHKLHPYDGNRYRGGTGGGAGFQFPKITSTS